jgi:23S rRNA (guanine745-N1)-methyltransferase
MKVLSAHNLVCPIDGFVLSQREHSLICPKGHNFDIARQGYMNLLVVQHKASRDPGDTKEMVAARSRFLRTGCYERIATTLATLTEKHLANLRVKEPVAILDAGCGEGYYLERMLEISANWQNPAAGILIGLDISKWAIQAAAKRSRAITWIVGSNRRPPIASKSIDLIVCAFGFPSYEIFRRVLKPSGKVILVDPAENHLLEMRQLIYAELKPRTLTASPFGMRPAALAEAEGFEQIEGCNLTYKAEVSKFELLQDLLMMTPHYFRCPPEGKLALAARDRLEFAVDVNFCVLALEN